MTLFFSKSKILGGAGGIVDPSSQFSVIRDWIGHRGYPTKEWRKAFDLYWDGVDYTAVGFQSGPYDANNRVHIIDGTSNMTCDADLGLLAWDTAPFVEFGFWLLADALPAVGSDTILNLFRIFNDDNDLYIRVDLILTSGGLTWIEGAHGDATGPGTRHAFRHPTAINTSGWIFVSVVFDHASASSVTVEIDHNNSVASGKPSGIGIPASTYDRIQVGVGSGVGGSNLKGFKFANLYVSRVKSTPGERADVRTYTLQGEYDVFIRQDLRPVHYFKNIDKPVNFGVIGDLFIHDIGEDLKRAVATMDTVNRAVLSGPLDVSNSYKFTNGAVAVGVDLNMSFYEQTTTFFYREAGDESNDNDWFMRIESPTGGYMQLERKTGGPSGKYLRMRIHPDNGDPDDVLDMLSTPLFDGFWHRVVWSSGSNLSEFQLAIDGFLYLPALPDYPAVIGTTSNLKWGNLDLNIALVASANEYDTEAFSVLPTKNLYNDLADYFRDENYKAFYPHQNQLTGL